ncbi:NAD(P)/FAD-dependent oxidoreductase [Oscillochloris sp. ZM17-4]|uniref:NAD(P)/FAD-dependent oxidoreductase n=1 Tax=Oscillochloris sp. ZM17-4 TaxID=2866714 RepID=UPI001C73CE66|nr:NAD(P)/FAD-dependent oxidoreductase [Oscillochloris sp. ZM17-4]MBX0331301.1 NAD(P)/FAD-dependent oxidoreductase [Oscillochloris sp. ZM17-4]
MAQGPDRYDIAIIGSGISGSTLGAILARHGLKVIIFEAGAHPKFAIGESMILETSETMRAMAELFDVPELAYFSSENFIAQIGTSHGLKRHFSYLHHREGQPQDLARSLQAVIPQRPHGYELHIHRQDSDYFLTSVAVRYGATVLQGTPVKDITLRPDGVEILTSQRQTYAADYVVDAGGMRSLLAEKFGWRSRDLRTHTRTIFTHMVDLPCYHQVGASHQEYGFPFPVSEGTLHHIFHGGWLWVIPFNNHPRATNPLVSVGLQLDPRIHPARPDLSPEQEFFAFIARFPSIAAQFHKARAARPWARADRLQYTATHVVGERFCLLGHAAGFIDPLYSKGLYTTLMSAALLAHLLLDAQRAGDYAPARFRPLEELTLRFVSAHDRLVANSITSWSNDKLWEVYAVLWLTGAYLEYVKLLSTRGLSKSRDDYFATVAGLRMVGGGFSEFDDLADRVDTLIEAVDPGDEAAVDRAVAEIRAAFAAVPWMPWAFQQVLAGSNHLPANKLRLSLLSQNTGFMGGGAYRKHFFGDASLAEVARFFVRESLTYSTAAQAIRKRLSFRRRRAAPAAAWAPRMRS